MSGEGDETKHDQFGCADAGPKKEIIRNATARALAETNINSNSGVVQHDQEPGSRRGRDVNENKRMVNKSDDGGNVTSGVRAKKKEINGYRTESDAAAPDCFGLVLQH